VLNGNSSDSANDPKLKSLEEAGDIQSHELDILATWWEDVQSEWPRLRWSDPLLRGRKGRARRLQRAIKAGRKFLNEILNDEIRKQLISHELYRVGTVDLGKKATRPRKGHNQNGLYL
jgi:hypothetical protein